VPVQDGFYVERRGDRDLVMGRFSGAEYRMEVAGGRVSFAGRGFAVHFDERDPAGSIQGEADAEVDLTYFEIMNRLRVALFASPEVNYVNCLSPHDRYQTS
jgi:hypothetical protein